MRVRTQVGRVLHEREVEDWAWWKNVWGGEVGVCKAAFKRIDGTAICGV